MPNKPKPTIVAARRVGTLDAHPVGRLRDDQLRILSAGEHPAVHFRKVADVNEPIARHLDVYPRVGIIDDDVRRRTRGYGSNLRRCEFAAMHSRGKAGSVAADDVNRHADDQHFGGQEHRDDRNARHLRAAGPSRRRWVEATARSSGHRRQPSAARRQDGPRREGFC